MKLSVEEIVRDMPKVELHAHLNGSISDALLDHIKNYEEHTSETGGLPRVDSPGVLMEQSKSAFSTYDIPKSLKGRSLKECWNAFAKIHEVIRTPAALYLATVNVIGEFARDNVIHLELRTGPKKIHNIPSKLSYIEAVLKGIQDGQEHFHIVVKLLVSIDRKNGEQEGFETVELAASISKRYPDIVVGVDVSGDPHYGSPDWVVPVMKEARRNGLKISCHLSEVDQIFTIEDMAILAMEIVNPEETIAFMTFGPERVGHGQFVHPKYRGTLELWELVKQTRIPIESCITSNLVSGVTASIEEHIVRIFHEESIPFLICTDDCGVFETTLSNEFRKLLNVVPLQPVQIQSLCLDACAYSFATDAEKESLKHKILKWWEEFCPVKI